jgi:hypothetical protein
MEMSKGIKDGQEAPGGQAKYAGRAALKALA